MSSSSSNSNQVALLKAESASIEARIKHASTKDEALSLAMQATELCIDALKLAPKPDRPEIRARCKFLLDEAERMKQIPVWTRPKKTPDLADAVANIDIRPGPSLRPHLKARASPAPSVYDPALVSRSPNILSQAYTPTPTHQPPKPKPAARLREPVSKRELPIAEKLLLLHASKLNGFKFPPWTGPPKPEEFHLDDGAEPFQDTTDLCLSEHQLKAFCGWKRAHEAIPPPSWFPGSRTNLQPTMQATRPIDLVQDAATDCSVVASLAAGTSRAGRGHAKILDEVMFPYDHDKQQPEISPNGKYVVKLNFNGCHRKVVVDDRLPVSSTQRLLHVIDRKNPALLWPALFEKAYLKVRGGYDFPGSNSSTDLWILIGWIPEQVFLQDDTTDPFDVWTRMFKAFQYGDVLVTMGTAKMSHRTERDSGLAGQHDYAVLDMKEDEDRKFMLLKNPWCEGGSWKGSIPQTSLQRFSMNDSRPSTPDSAKEDLSPGTFWIDWNNVLQYFDSIYLNWNSGLFSHRQDIHFAWDLTSHRSATGSFINNPQFAVACSKGGTLWLLLCRHFKDTAELSGDSSLNVNVGPAGEFIGYMSLYVYDRNGQRMPISCTPLERGPYVDSPQTLVRLDVPAQTTYTVVISEQGLPPLNHTFSFMAFSDMKVQISEATSRFEHTSTVESAWTNATAGGGAHIVTYSTNPQFSLMVAHDTTLAMLLETPSSDLNVHVKLVRGHGKRIISLTRKDIIVDSGDYRRGSAYAEITEMEAGTYTVICSTFEANQKAPFTLRVESQVSTQLKQLPGENAGRLSRKLPMACFNWNNNKIAASISPLRLVKLSAIAKFRGSSAPTTRSPVRLSIELGRGPERRILGVSNEGEYCYAGDGAGGGAGEVRTPELDLWAEMRRFAEMYLVVERMAGPETTGEERFDVEVWCDAKVQEVCEIGTWRKWDD
ncbi:2-nitropropane dioxygenase [Venturia nashicola]|uniref:2-nitropropane dioxygenase n=1 Tax=Venturia nashicola TaxID=86259 RepID=A0A4Z1P014_9PEZI|nr:2-nitropropane dioxygenase [Venturia nashicola]TLD20207.1 2-nitropropane dioxygenase [Venturia nashicola]